MSSLRDAEPAESSDTRRLTPMLRQYRDAKAEVPGALLLFRMGDFFEMFFEDAVTAARELDLTLTSRDKDGVDPIPMAGVPHHAVGPYIARLVQRGYTVALCDQIEDPKTAKGLVRRAITRVITPGTVADLDALDPSAPNYLGCVGPLAEPSGACVLTLLDLLAGELLCTELDLTSLADECERMGVRELLVEEADVARVQQALGAGEHAPVRAQTDPPASDEMVRAFLVARLGVADIAGLESAGAVAPVARRALARLLTFAESTQRRVLTHVMPARAYRTRDFLVLDEATRRNLELCSTREGRRGSLLWHIDRCRTAIGTRLLSHWLLFPLLDRAAIERRLDVVAVCKRERTWRQVVQRELSRVRDLERLVGRVAVGRATPRDLGALRETLLAVPELVLQLQGQPTELGRRWGALDPADAERELLVSALVDEPPSQVGDGGIFKRGFAPDLDDLMSVADDGHAILVDIERRERARTGIQSLKVRFNRVFGYYIEVTRANLGSVPADYVRKQTLVGAERFITEELKRYEDKVVNADARQKARELEAFAELCTRLGQATTRLRAISRLIAETDALLALAELADEGRYERPTLCDEPVLELRESRHPVIERLLPGGERFIANDVHLDARDRQLLIVTGPNMAGKSTVMRQAALCALLAHMGSFVPAKSARVGLCDRIFTRVGAADNLGRGQSTFMVEMLETAGILRYATKQSLVLLDEIGRGTSTFDGVSIAWAVAEHLHDVTGCRTMFATHYHELTDLALERPRIVNVSVAVKEHNEQIVFLRRLVDGAANRSYGIQVARLAGVPEGVLARAREVLANLERGELDETGMPTLAFSRTMNAGRAAQLGLFARQGAADQAPAALPSPLERELWALDPLRMTPIEALAALDRLRHLLDQKPT